MATNDCASLSTLFTPGAVSPDGCCLGLHLGGISIGCDNTNARITQLAVDSAMMPAGVSFATDRVAEVSTLTQLQTLRLASVGLSGAVPGSMAALTSLQTLDLSRNALSGVLPSSFDRLKALLDVFNFNLCFFFFFLCMGLPAGMCRSAANVGPPCAATMPMSACPTTAVPTPTATSRPAVEPTPTPGGAAVPAGTSKPGGGPMSAGAWVGLSLAITVCAIAVALLLLRGRRHRHMHHAILDKRSPAVAVAESATWMTPPHSAKQFTAPHELLAHEFDDDVDNEGDEEEAGSVGGGIWSANQRTLTAGRRHGAGGAGGGGEGTLRHQPSVRQLQVLNSGASARSHSICISVDEDDNGDDDDVDVDDRGRSRRAAYESVPPPPPARPVSGDYFADYSEPLLGAAMLPSPSLDESVAQVSSSSPATTVVPPPPQQQRTGGAAAQRRSMLAVSLLAGSTSTATAQTSTSSAASAMMSPSAGGGGPTSPTTGPRPLVLPGLGRPGALLGSTAGVAIHGQWVGPGPSPVLLGRGGGSSVVPYARLVHPPQADSVRDLAPPTPTTTVCDWTAVTADWDAIADSVQGRVARYLARGGDEAAVAGDAAWTLMQAMSTTTTTTNHGDYHSVMSPPPSRAARTAAVMHFISCDLAKFLAAVQSTTAVARAARDAFGEAAADPGAGAAAFGAVADAAVVMTTASAPTTPDATGLSIDAAEPAVTYLAPAATIMNTDDVSVDARVHRVARKSAARFAASVARLAREFEHTLNLLEEASPMSGGDFGIGDGHQRNSRHGSSNHDGEHEGDMAADLALLEHGGALDGLADARLARLEAELERRMTSSASSHLDIGHQHRARSSSVRSPTSPSSMSVSDLSTSTSADNPFLTSALPLADLFASAAVRWARMKRLRPALALAIPDAGSARDNASAKPYSRVACAYWPALVEAVAEWAYRVVRPARVWMCET
ncbi:hypothetical protein BC828DRAFT_382581 [Blastocladiella britannica]|nr:hypothetical protein BC828DRAFT_382581 [Blastocladiella britannica]